MNVHRVELAFGPEPLSLETGRLAQQADGAVVAEVGGTTVLVAVTRSEEPLQGRDFFPLMVDYREKFYASGRIPGSFFRRESRPGDPETLKARLIDRAIRPLFPEGLRHEVMVYVTVLSSDNVNPADVPALNAASLALQLSDVPFPTPVAAVRVASLEGELVLNPTYPQLEKAELDLVVAGTSTAINMVEAGAREVSEAVVLKALSLGHEAIVRLIEGMRPVGERAGKPKFDPATPTLPDDARARLRELAAAPLAELVRAGLSKSAYNAREAAIRAETVKAMEATHAPWVHALPAAFETLHAEEVRRLVCKEGRRVDGRGFTEIRPVSCEVGVLARAHGSALFTRGQTQALGSATLGTLEDAQKIDNLFGISDKRFLLHYNFPPFSVGEARPMRGPGRREIGHGMLAERALAPLVPDFADFPYTIRVVSEILESNGSSSMASVCAGCLALMDAGIPIRKPVAGIAMGLVAYEGDHAILTDIQGVEDHLGDMDFKVAGTRDGITALQMDIKVESLPVALLEKALHQAREARLAILESMRQTLPAPRPELSPYAPRLTILQIPIDKIGAVIGPGGKIIRGIIERTGVRIDVEDDGKVYIASTDGQAAEAAVAEIRALTVEAEMDRIYSGRVVRVTDFGAFVQILPNKDGLIHISELDEARVERVEDVLRVGDEVRAKVINIDESGRVRLSRRLVLMEERGATEEEMARPEFRPRRGEREGRGPRRGGGGPEGRRGGPGFHGGGPARGGRPGEGTFSRGGRGDGEPGRGGLGFRERRRGGRE